MTTKRERGRVSGPTLIDQTSPDQSAESSVSVTQPGDDVDCRLPRREIRDQGRGWWLYAGAGVWSL